MGRPLRYRRLLLFLLLLPALCAAPYVWAIIRGARVRIENHGQIEHGMSAREVEAILGAPPGDYTTRPAVIAFGCRVASPEYWLARPYNERYWFTDRGALCVDFDANGRVQVTQYTSYVWPLSLRERLDEIKFVREHRLW